MEEHGKWCHENTACKLWDTTDSANDQVLQQINWKKNGRWVRDGREHIERSLFL